MVSGMSGSSLQDVRYGDRAVAADRLREGHPGARDLVRTRFAAELRGGLDDLIGAARPHWMPARLESAEGRERNAAAAGETAVRGPLQRLAARRESARLERQGGDDRERVVRLEQIEILGRETAGRERLLRRALGGAEGEQI